MCSYNKTHPSPSGRVRAQEQTDGVSGEPVCSRVDRDDYAIADCVDRGALGRLRGRCPSAPILLSRESFLQRRTGSPWPLQAKPRRAREGRDPPAAVPPCRSHRDRWCRSMSNRQREKQHGRRSERELSLHVQAEGPTPRPPRSPPRFLRSRRPFRSTPGVFCFGSFFNNTSCGAARNTFFCYAARTARRIPPYRWVAYCPSRFSCYSEAPRGHKTKRGLHFHQLAWVDSNYRPHAYQASYR